MIIGCFALVEPFTPMQRQFGVIQEMGIKHFHWKDIEADWEEKRGSVHGCGMPVITLGDGVIDLPPIVKALQDVGFDRATTLEIAGPDYVKGSFQRFKEWSGE